MVYLPGGTFRMGDEAGASDETPAHWVRIDPFAIGRTPVTWGEYRLFCADTDTHWPEWLEKGSQYDLDTDDDYRKRGVADDALLLPVVGISWHDAVAYCAWLAERTGKGYRLPTEAEWEYACRAGTDTFYSFGDDAGELGRFAWYSANAGGKLHPVGQKAANPWGLLDLHGNVWEWCADFYSRSTYEKRNPAAGAVARDTVAAAGPAGDLADDAAASATYPPNAEASAANENPSGPGTGSDRVIRGGSWAVVADGCRSSSRNNRHPSRRHAYLGFRLSRTV
jgi:formylglycine-generating enzyme required for sulfatase activity